jgi:hypothetical protein
MGDVVLLSDPYKALLLLVFIAGFMCGVLLEEMRKRAANDKPKCPPVRLKVREEGCPRCQSVMELVHSGPSTAEMGKTDTSYICRSCGALVVNGMIIGEVVKNG